MKNILFFESMLTPKIITLIYWLLLLIAVISGLTEMGGGYAGPSFTSIVMGLITIVIGAIAARLFCELIIVVFRIHDYLKHLATK